VSHELLTTPVRSGRGGSGSLRRDLDEPARRGPGTMDPTPTGDRDLVARITAGDQSALAACFDLHAGAMLGLARRVLGDEHRAEDIVQAVLLRLWTEPQRYDADRGALRSFLYRETQSRAIELVRTEQARAARERRELDARPTTTRGDDVEQEAWAMIRAEVVRDALATLSPGEREVIELAYFGGHSYRDVAHLLQLPEGTVKSRIRTGLAKLADRLETSGLELRHDHG
jgi:RNA polymerase sigma-70 factor, ECF subfamily